MFVHSVFFYLKKELSEEQRQKFFSGVETLKTVQPHVKILTGTPADTDRPIVLKDYDYGLTCIFENIEDHDKYQVDPVHLEFVDNHKNDWDKVVIYDFD